MTRILHTLPNVGPGSFGVGAAARSLAFQQIQSGCEASFWSLSSETDTSWASRNSGIEADRFVNFSAVGPERLAFSPAMERAAAGRAGQQFDVVHQHSLWTGISRVTRVLHKHHDLPVVIAPHGTLTDWALRRSRVKKRLALALYERENLRSAACLHAVADREIAEIRAFGLQNPVALLPNGISESWLESTGSAERFRMAFHLPPDRRIMLFLSRISQKKGLPLLLQALQQCGVAFNDWLLVIAGTDEFGHLAELQALISKLGLETSVKFVGPLIDQDKRDAFAAAELFVLTSHSEGAPVVIPEALAAGVPVLATQASPWPELISHSCGWWPEINLQSIYEMLIDALSSSSDRLFTMGQHGRALIKAQYTWSRIAPRTLLLYDWLLGGGSKPDFVVLD
ncbi:MAG: glycosyltransferase [Anaerolinea sp.]|nr:glycosyltransferase [Anaerolinea sp.]